MIKIDLNIKDIQKLLKDYSKIKEEAIRHAEKLLVPAIYQKIQELAKQKLHSTRNPFLENVRVVQVSADVWHITLDSKYVWIDDGLRPHEMIDDLLKNADTNKKGEKYKVIPFFHGPGRGPQNSTKAQLDLQSTIRAELKRIENEITNKKGIPYAKIEKDASGKPLEGLLHSFDVNSGPVREGAGRWAGAGQGWGPIGAVRQGKTGIPFLHGVRIYQKMAKQPDGSMKAQRAIMTFRTVNENMKGSGRWFHPGKPPAHIMEEAAEWGLKHWEEVILPLLMKKIDTI